MPILRFFAPQGRHVAQMGGGEIWHGGGPLLRAKFHAHRCNDKGVGHQKLKFLLRFDQTVEYKRPLRIPCSIFTKFAQFVPHFRMRWVLKFRWICSMAYGVIGVLSWWCLVAAKFSAARSGETICIRPQKVLEVQERARGPLSPCQLWWGSDFTRRRDSHKRWVFLSVCLFVTLASAKLARWR